MADDKTLPHGAEPARIHVHEDAEVHDWAKKFDVSPDQIRDAVRAVGDRADEVEMHLKGTRATSNADQQQAADDR